MSCLSQDTLVEMAAGTLGLSEWHVAELHLDVCPTCQAAAGATSTPDQIEVPAPIEERPDPRPRLSLRWMRWLATGTQ
jgi:hypothetical protein